MLSDRQEHVPAIVHLHGTARIQTVNKGDNYLLWSAWRSIDRHLGVPILCNTSLNDIGEPIANTLDDALTFCIRKQITILYIDGFRCNVRSNTPQVSLPVSSRLSEEFSSANDEQDSTHSILNPFQLSTNELSLWYHSEQRSVHDPRSAVGARAVRAYAATRRRESKPTETR